MTTEEPAKRRGRKRKYADAVIAEIKALRGEIVPHIEIRATHTEGLREWCAPRVQRALRRHS